MIRGRPRKHRWSPGFFRGGMASPCHEPSRTICKPFESHPLSVLTAPLASLQPSSSMQVCEQVEDQMVMRCLKLGFRYIGMKVCGSCCNWMDNDDDDDANDDDGDDLH